MPVRSIIPGFAMGGRFIPARKSKKRKNESYRKTKKKVRKLQRAGMLEAGPMFQKWRKAARISKTGKRRNPSDALGKKIDKLLREIYASQDPMQKERLFKGKTPKYRRMSKTYMGRLKRLDALQKQYREREGIS